MGKDQYWAKSISAISKSFMAQACVSQKHRTNQLATELIGNGQLEKRAWLNIDTSLPNMIFTLQYS